MACSRFCGLQHFGGSLHYPGMFGSKHYHAVNQNHQNCQHRLVELLAFRFHWGGSLFCNGKYLVGILLCHHLLHHHIDYGRPDLQTVPVLLRKMDGISIPQPFCQGFVPFALVINKVLDKIPGFDKLNIDAEGMKRKFGIMGEPLFLGVVVGCVIGALACKNTDELIDGIPAILGLGIKMGAVMELIPRITSLFIEGLRPISDATRELIARKFKNSASLNIGMSPALVIGHPTTLVVSLLLIPVALFLSVVLPGNQFLPLASLAGMFYLFPAVLPITKGNVLKTFLIGLVALIVGLYFVTDLAPFFTQAAQDVFIRTNDTAVQIPEGFQGGALDFASSIFSWLIFHAVYNFKIVGSAILVIVALAMAIYNRRRIIKEAKHIEE